MVFEKQRLVRNITIGLNENLTRLNVFLAILIVFFVLWVASLFWGYANLLLSKLLSNPYWTVLILLYELYRQQADEKLISDRDTKIEKLKAVLNQGTTYDHRYLLAIIEGKDGDIAANDVDLYMEERIKKDNPIA